jgi:hypothetical protein
LNGFQETEDAFKHVARDFSPVEWLQEQLRRYPFVVGGALFARPPIE